MKPATKKTVAVKKPAREIFKGGRTALPWVERALQEEFASALAHRDTFHGVANLATAYSEYQYGSARVAATRLETLRRLVADHATSDVNAKRFSNSDLLEAKFGPQFDAVKTQKARKALFAVYTAEQTALHEAYVRAHGRAVKLWGIPAAV